MTKPSDKVTDFVGPSQPDELAVLMVKYGPALRRYFLRKADANAADDLVQEVFLRLQVSASQSSLEDVERFIFTIAKRVLIDRRRFDERRSLGLHQTFDESADRELLDAITPERTLAAKQEVARVLTTVTSMPPRMQMAFVLHRFGKMSYSAIAKRMGIGKSAVQDLMERALARITNDLGDVP